ncbi:hypothetical protein D9M68_790460 [compost metagenome]|nr:hypothetical protein APB48_20675 [Pseudomonas aeruginosa]KXD90933.1 hypothetical protein AW915_04125 [Pseudomonas aeruginosa]
MSQLLGLRITPLQQWQISEIRIEHVAVAEEWNTVTRVINPNACEHWAVVDAARMPFSQCAQHILAYLELLQCVARLQCA